MNLSEEEEEEEKKKEEKVVENTFHKVIIFCDIAVN